MTQADEVHRSGASTYPKVLEYFKPKFLLGMSATPERMDGFDIFKAFDYNIAYEIRLKRALEENMLYTFYYYGVSEIEIGGQILSDKAEFNLLSSDERVNRIIEKSKFYGCDRGRIKSLIFCSRVEEARVLSNKFNAMGFKTIALDGSSSEDEREAAIIKLEQDSSTKDTLDYIFTVDIFNEGVDIPSINQIIMLRPTQSSIIFIQQLGRGLRKKHGKEFLVVIDFIGKYNNNFLIPINVEFCMKNSTSSTTGKIYFTTVAEGSFDESKSKTFTITANDSIYRVYTIDMTSVAKWTGTLRQIRIDPEEGVSSGSFSIDYTRIGNGTYYVEPYIDRLVPVNVTTRPSIYPVLPATVRAIYSDGSSKNLSVLWAPVTQHGSLGSFTISGTVTGSILSASATVVVSHTADWEFNQSAEGWGLGSGINYFGFTPDGSIGGTISAADPNIFSSYNLGLNLTYNKIIKIRMQNKMLSNSAKMYFITAADGTWSEAKSKSFTTVALDSGYTEYTLDMSTVSGWTGTLMQLRFDHLETGGGSFNIDYIRILPYAWEFYNTAEGWTTGGYMGATYNYSDPQIVSLDNLLSDISSKTTIQIRMKNSSASTSANLYFTTTCSTSFDSTKSKSFAIVANDPNYTVYTLNMSTVTGWGGTLKQIRLDPQEGSWSGSCSIDYIRIS